MKRSESITNLAAALSKAQGEFESASRDHTAKVRTKDGGEYSYNFADLASVLSVVREPLAKNGLSVVQLPVVAEDRTSISVTTTLMHESGEFIETDPLVMPISTDLRGPQAIGSSITYGRRYALSAILGIATEVDDDGNAGSGNQAATEPRTRAALPPCPKCHKTTSVIVGKPEFGGGFVCFQKKEGCGYKWQSGQEHADPQADHDKKRQAQSGEDSQVQPKEPPTKKPDQVFVALKKRLHEIGCTDAHQASAVVRFATGKTPEGKYEFQTLESVEMTPGAPAKVLQKLIEASHFPDHVILHDALEQAGLLKTEGAAT